MRWILSTKQPSSALAAGASRHFHRISHHCSTITAHRLPHSSSLIGTRHRAKTDIPTARRPTSSAITPSTARSTAAARSAPAHSSWQASTASTSLHRKKQHRSTATLPITESRAVASATSRCQCSQAFQSPSRKHSQAFSPPSRKHSQAFMPQSRKHSQAFSPSSRKHISPLVPQDAQLSAPTTASAPPSIVLQQLRVSPELRTSNIISLLTSS